MESLSLPASSVVSHMYLPVPNAAPVGSARRARVGWPDVNMCASCDRMLVGRRLPESKHARDFVQAHQVQHRRGPRSDRSAHRDGVHPGRRGRGQAAWRGRTQ
eukprot:8840067-Pyramimonas_sp.AAC.1